MPLLPQEHPFAQVCAKHNAVCTQDATAGITLVVRGDDSLAFYGDTEAFLQTMAQKRYTKLLHKMLYLAKMQVSPVFLVNKHMLWTERMMELECEWMTDKANMLARFFAIVSEPAKGKMQESGNALFCAFRPVGFRYNCENRGHQYCLDISLAYNTIFARKVYTLSDIAEQFHLSADILTLMGEPGSGEWWAAMRDLALIRYVKPEQLELPELNLF